MIKLRVSQEPMCISITAIDGDRPFGAAALNSSYFGSLDATTWYLNRLFVNEKYRAQGLGSKLLVRLKKAFADRAVDHPDWPQCSRVLVEPGGYGSDINDLLRFYQRRGFKPNDELKCFVLDL